MFGFYVTMTGYGGILETQRSPIHHENPAHDMDSDRLWVSVEPATVGTFDIRIDEHFIRVFTPMTALSTETWAKLATAVLGIVGDL